MGKRYMVVILAGLVGFVVFVSVGPEPDPMVDPRGEPDPAKVGREYRPDPLPPVCMQALSASAQVAAEIERTHETASAEVSAVHSALSESRLRELVRACDERKM